MAESLGHKVIRGTIWASIDRIGTMALQFIVNLILARLLMPKDFGYIGMLAIFISVSQTLVDGGFGSALIQKKEPTQKDYSTIFYWNLIFSVILYVVLYVAAPYVALFFKLPLLSKILRTQGLILIVNALVIVQNNRLRKQLAFQTIALINIGSLLAASVIAIYVAYKGFGVWSLVIMQLMYGFLQNCLLWGVVRWVPDWTFSFESLKNLFGFGGYLLAANILQVICLNMQGIIIGRKFSATQMGFYTQAKKLDDVGSATLPNIIVQVIFPVYSQFQNNKQKLQELLGMSVRIISYLIFPLMLLLILISEPLIVFLYGEKWLPCVPYFQILCFGGIFACLQNINYYAVAAVGKSEVLFGWSFYKWGILLALLLVGSLWGMYGILWGMVISSINIFIVNAALAFKYVGYTISRQVRDVIPCLIIGLLSFVCAYLFKIYIPNMHFIVIGLSFGTIYIAMTWIFHLQVVTDIAHIRMSLIK